MSTAQTAGFGPEVVAAACKKYGAAWQSALAPWALRWHKDGELWIATGRPRKVGRPRAANPRSKSVIIRLTADEHSQIRENAAMAGLSVSAYIRHCALHKGD